MSYQLAQVNIGRIRGAMDSAVMAGFAARLDEVNALADSAPGFVWRLQSAEGNATSIHVFDDEMLLINMSVWDSVDSLFAFTYRTDHIELLRQRAEWFERMDTHYMALWWVPAGHIPTPHEAKARIEYMDSHGPTAYAFTFKQRFAPETVQSSGV